MNIKIRILRGKNVLSLRSSYQIDVFIEAVISRLTIVTTCYIRYTPLYPLRLPDLRPRDK